MPRHLCNLHALPPLLPRSIFQISLLTFVKSSLHTCMLVPDGMQSAPTAVLIFVALSSGEGSKISTTTFCCICTQPLTRSATLYGLTSHVLAIEKTHQVCCGQLSMRCACKASASAAVPVRTRNVTRPSSRMPEKMTAFSPPFLQAMPANKREFRINSKLPILRITTRTPPPAPAPVPWFCTSSS